MNPVSIQNSKTAKVPLCKHSMLNSQRARSHQERNDSLDSGVWRNHSAFSRKMARDWIYVCESTDFFFFLSFPFHVCSRSRPSPSSKKRATDWERPLDGLSSFLSQKKNHFPLITSVHEMPPLGSHSFGFQISPPVNNQILLGRCKILRFLRSLGLTVLEFIRSSENKF